MKRYPVWLPATFHELSSGKPVFGVTRSRQLKLLDMVAVLNSSGEPEIRAGDVGTVVDLLPPDGLEVEFLGPDGRTRHVGTLSTGDVLVLNRERTRVA